MGYVVTDLARLPADGFEWFVFFLEDSYQDDLRRELAENFEALARDVGPACLVIRGADREGFWSDVLFTYAIEGRGIKRENLPLPGLLVTDTPVSDLQANPDTAASAKVILISLAQRYRRPGSVTDILRHISQAVRDPAAMRALEVKDIDGLRNHWGWIPKYLEMKPSFCGFGVDLDAIIEDQLFEGKLRPGGVTGKLRSWFRRSEA